MDGIPLEIMDGPAMRALRDDRQRKFAWLMANGEPHAAEAARLAGFSDKSGGAGVRGHHLMHNPAVLDAIEEAGRKVLRGLAPLAIRRAREVLDNPKHPAHTRMIETILDRTGFSAKTEHKVTVEHSVDVRELEALAARLARENNIDPARLIGSNSVIEGEVAVEEPS